MLQAPEKYLNSILSKGGLEKSLPRLIQYFICHCNSNLHFIIDEKEIELPLLLTAYCHQLEGARTFAFKVGQKVSQLKNPKQTFSKSALQSFFSPYTIVNIDTEITLSNVATAKRSVTNLDKFIPISSYKIERAGIIQNRIEAYEQAFNPTSQADFFSNEKLLVVGNRNLFKDIPLAYPACFVSESGEGETVIEYNSPLLPKISILKHINLLDNYLNQEINGNSVTFGTCIFVGNSKFENSINVIRNYFNQQKFLRAVFIGEKDIKIDLGNGRLPLRWKWTIPEINFFQGRRSIQHEVISIQNSILEEAITEFYKAVREIESKHTISLKTIYRFIRRLYYDWNLKQEATLSKLQRIQDEFNIAIKRVLIETLSNIYVDFDFDVYQKPLTEKFARIVNVVSGNNKTERVKTYPFKINQIVMPSFLCHANNVELTQIFNQSVNKTSIHSLQEIGKLASIKEKEFSDKSRPYYSLIGNQAKAEIVPFSKTDDSKEKETKIISSIYGSGKVERLIERLGRAKTEYKLLLYSIEAKALKYHVEGYISDLNREYVSQDRFKICGVTFSDNYYSFSTFDELMDALASTRHENRETDSYKITFTDNLKVKLPSSKSVLKTVGKDKLVVSVEDLSVGDNVFIYWNPDKKILRDIIELMNPELMKKANELSLFWRTCLKDAYQANVMAEPLYHQLVRNHFSVSEFTFRKYIDGEVMFPRSFSDLIIIAKTINNERLSFDFLKNVMKPKIEEYRGVEIEYGFKFSNSINHYIITGEADEFISEWLRKEEIDSIVSQIPVKTIKEIDLITVPNNDE